MPAHADRLQPGTKIDDYTLDEVLGVGGFGTVYRGRSASGEVVAIKLSTKVPAEFTTRHFIWQQNEIEALKRLHHPSLVRLVDFNYLDSGQLYLAMDVVEGEPLSDYLRRHKRLEPIEAVKIVRNVADALAHCHKLNILHLDLKPSNIIVTDPHESKIKILDFGLAHLRESWQPSEDPLRAGTVAYMAPEYFRPGEAVKLSPRLDMYALGVILYEMLAGNNPFTAASISEMLQLKLDMPAPSLRDTAPRVDEVLAELVDRLLERNPTQRLADAGLLCARLRELYFHILRGDRGTSEDDTAVDVVHSTPVIAVSPFVGRRDQMTAIIDHFQSLSEDRGLAVMVSGEAGIGKSRLISEILSHPALSSGALIGYARCRDLGGRVPYAPIRELLGHLARTLRSLPPEAEETRALHASLSEAIAEDVDLLTALAPEFRDLVSSDSTSPAASTLVGADRVAQSLRRVFTALGRMHRYVAVIEDLHWADQGTGTVLRQLIDPTTPPGIFMIGTTRSDVVEPHVEFIRLSTLDPGDRDSLLQSLTLDADAGTVGTLRQAVPLLAVGNPLLTTQVVQNMWLEGYLYQDANGQTCVREDLIGGYQPPESITSVLARIVERLDDASRTVLGVASLIGRQFSVTDLVGLQLFVVQDVHAALEAAEQYHLCRLMGTECSFAHDTIREHLEGTVPGDQLGTIHALIARQFEARGAAPGTVAYHLERAGEPRDAGRAYLDAAREADRVHDLVGAYGYLERGIDLLTRAADSPERSQLVLSSAYELARIGCTLGNTQHLIDRLDECANLLGDAQPRELIPLHAAYARVYYVAGDFPNAGAKSRLVLQTGGDDPRAQPYLTVPANILGRALAASGKFGPAVKLLTDGCRLAEEAGERLELSHSQGLLSVALGFTANFDEARRVAETCAQLALEVGDPVRWLGALLYDSARCESEFNWDYGVERSTALLAYADEQHIGGLYLYVGTVFAGRHQFHIGQLDRARVLLKNSINLSNLLGITMLIGWAHAFLGDTYFVDGNLARAYRAYEQGLELCNAGAKDEYGAPLALTGLAHVSAYQGADVTTVRNYADEAIERLTAVGNESALAPTYQRYADALEVGGDSEGAAWARERFDEVARRLATPIPDWWPRIPERPIADEPTVATVAKYWQGRWKTMEMSGDVGGDETRGALDPSSSVEAMSLMDRLATVSGYIPLFAHGGLPSSSD